MGCCIFCLKEKPESELTDEHVFPAALGGVLVIKNGSCVTCNNGCSKFEQTIATELIPLRHLLHIPDRRGEIPQTTATFKVGEKEYEARVKGDGTVQLKPVVTEVLGSACAGISAPVCDGAAEGETASRSKGKGASVYRVGTGGTNDG
jgi:hypothetical protein